MELLTSYNLIIAASIILILSFWFNGIAKKTNIPPVFMLIALGVVLQYVLRYFVKVPLDFFPLLEVLGIIGLIMIVLEAALELELKREKLWPILRSLAIALIGLLGSAYVAAQILYYFIPEMTLHSAWLYATTLSILSSAIIIPSIGGLAPDKKEFHIYEGTFADILGIIIGTSLIMAFAMIRDKRKIGTLIDELDKEFRARDESCKGIAHEGHTVLASPVMEVLPEGPITKKPDPEDPEERQFEG